MDTFIEERLHPSLFKKRKDAPKVGYIYLIKANDLYKIGITTDPKLRLGAYRTGLACAIQEFICVPHKGYRALEARLHKKYSGNADHAEWCRFNDSEIDEILGFMAS